MLRLLGEVLPNIILVRVGPVSLGELLAQPITDVPELVIEEILQAFELCLQQRIQLVDG